MRGKDMSLGLAVLTAYVKKWTTNMRREEKAEGAAEFGRKKKQQNSNMASWLGTNIKILSFERKHFCKFSAQLSETKLLYSKHTYFPLQATDVIDATALA